jgi:hypothetical protein
VNTATPYVLYTLADRWTISCICRYTNIACKTYIKTMQADPTEQGGGEDKKNVNFWQQFSYWRGKCMHDNTLGLSAPPCSVHLRIQSTEVYVSKK